MIFVSRVVDPRGILGKPQRFGVKYCLHLHGVTTQKTKINIFIAVRTSDIK